MTPAPVGRKTRLGALSPREVQVAARLAQGFTNAEIGEQLGVSTKTVDTHRMHALRKTGARNNAQLTLWAYRHHYIDEHGARLDGVP